MSKKPARASDAPREGINDDIGEEMRLKMYRMQVEIREAEQRAFDLFLQNLVKGTSHLSLGQEAVATGFAAAMKPGDLSFCTYRGHAHTLARGVPIEKVLGELMQRDNGLMRGKGGSMHLTSAEHGVMGSYAIIGAHLPIACGAAWRAQYKGDKDVSVCFFGDGTTNIGAFHEALNFAAVWKLPVIFVCENNLYMEYTPIGERDRGRASRRRPRLRLRAAAHRDRRQRCRRGLSRGARRLRQGARRRRPVADRVHDLPPQRPFARRPRQVPAGGRAREMEGARPDQDLPRAAEAVRHRRGRHREDRGRREARRRRGDRERARPRRRRRSIFSPPTSMPTEAGHGGTDLSRCGRTRHRPGDDARSRRGVPRRGRRRGGRRVQGHGRAAASSSARCACAIRRSPSRRSSAPPWARR